MVRVERLFFVDGNGKALVCPYKTNFSLTLRRDMDDPWNLKPSYDECCVELAVKSLIRPYVDRLAPTPAACW